MNDFWNGALIGIVAGVISGVVMAGFLVRKKSERFVNEAERVKNENLIKIEKFIADKEKFTNDDLEKFLGVSNTTVGRYLQELESSGKIKQVGETGKFVYYTKI